MRQELEYIYEVYRQGTISKAAEKLFVSQPALSMSIRKTEETIGMSLFDRSSRPMRLTEAGKLYIASIEKIRLEEESLLRQINDLNDLTSGSICIGGSHYFNAYILPSLLTAFHRQYPGVRFSLVEGSSARLSEMLSSHSIDLTFSCNESFIKNFESFPLFCDNILLAVPENDPVNDRHRAEVLTAEDVLNNRHLSANCPSVKLRDMEGLSYIILQEGNNLHDRAIEMFRAEALEPHIVLELAQLATAYKLAAGGFGATFTCDRLVMHEQDPLCFYKPDSPLTRRLFYAVLPKQDYTPKAVRALIHLLRRSLI